MYNYKYPHTHTHPEIERDQRQSIANQETHQEDSHWDKQDQSTKKTYSGLPTISGEKSKG